MTNHVDVYLPALLRPARLSIGLVRTKEACQTAQGAHQLSSTSAIALGRMLTAAALYGLVQERRGGLSLQVVGSGRLGQLFADVTPEGHLRGYVKNANFALPLFPGEAADGRRSVAAGVGQGSLAVMRLGVGTQFTHSTTELVSGEIDVDVENFLTTSEQIPTALACDVLLDKKNKVELAGGVIIQALPDADYERLAVLRGAVHNGGFASLLRQHEGDVHALLRALAPDAEEIEAPREIRWQCRCSHQRVLAALSALDTMQLADMVQKGEPAMVHCDFCGRTYQIPTDEIAEVYQSRLTASS